MPDTVQARYANIELTCTRVVATVFGFQFARRGHVEPRGGFGESRDARRQPSVETAARASGRRADGRARRDGAVDWR